MASEVIETLVDDPEFLRVVLSQECDDIIEGVKGLSYLMQNGGKTQNQHYLGSVPLVVANIWAGMCGAPVGTREFADFGRKMLMDGEYSKLKAHLK